ncbi:MAG: glycosyltransferase family 4 protein [Desulfovibrio sp.]|jgi:glycosyltransferase involved in cell wall biosynthesis|nr:glycosyltransferase family 4 protein [Desulfovibrio sp.]
MKIAVLGNQARAMSNFWTVLLRCMTAAGHEVLCLIPHSGAVDDPVWEDTLVAAGARLVHYRLDRKGLNPLRDLFCIFDLWRIFRRERPDRLFAYAIKPVIYGSLAAAVAGAPDRAGRSLMITGLGYAFEGDSLPKRLLMFLAGFLYRLAFSLSGLVLFQNGDDRNLFARLGILPASGKVMLCKGTGVDLGRFTFCPQALGAPLFLYVGRLVAAKGLREFMAAARLTRTRYPQAIFRIVGPPEPGPGGVPLQEVLAAQAAGDVEYLGESPDVRPHLEAARALVLPSYREGSPVSPLEAMACGRAVLAADAPGSREVVIHGVTGFLSPPGDVKALAADMESLIKDAGLAAEMGRRGRAFVEKEYDAVKVAGDLLQQIGVKG